MSGRRELLETITDGSNPLDIDPLSRFIVQLVLIIIVARVLGHLFRYIKQPQVVAEVITGIILGPTVMGHIPGYMENVFPTTSISTTLTVFANIGLIFFMFLIGVELDPSLLKNNAKSSITIAVASMATPFGIGAVLSILLYNMYVDSSKVAFSSFLLFIAVAMCITAFPVLARILTEQRMTHDRIGLTALSAAAVNDVVAWILLAIVVSIAKASSPLSSLWTILIMIGFFLTMWFCVRPVLEKLNEKAEKSDSVKHHLVVIVFLTTLISAWLTDVIGIDAIFGGFVTGIICPKGRGFAMYLTERIEDIIVVLLLPLYFTVSGLKTNLGDLNTAKSWGICFLVIILACIGKIVGSMAAAKFLGNGWRESFTVGVLMNTKGLVELIVLNLGLSAGVLTPELFAIFVMMALITTMLTSPILHFVWIRNEEKKAAPHIHDSFKVMMCVSNELTGMAMTSIAATLSIHKRRKFSVQALHVKEVTESPSSYFFAHKTAIPRFLEVVQERARALKLPLKLKQIFAGDVAEDLDYYCRTKNFDLIMIAWNEPLIETGGSKIKQVLAHTPATVAVLVDKGVHEAVSIQKVLAVYTGEHYQKEALKIARRMCRKKGTDVTLVSSVAAKEIGITENEPLNFVFTDRAMAQGIEESRRGYDLVVVGIAREWSAHEDTILQATDLLALSPVSVLLVHPKLEGLHSKSRLRRRKKVDLGEEKARLYLAGDTKLSVLGGQGSNRSSVDFSANGVDHGSDSSSEETLDATSPPLGHPDFAKDDSSPENLHAHYGADDEDPRATYPSRAALRESQYDSLQTYPVRRPSQAQDPLRSSQGIDMRPSISHDSLRMLDNMRHSHSITPSQSHDSLNTLDAPRPSLSQAVLDSIRPSVSHDNLRGVTTDDWPSPPPLGIRSSAAQDMRGSSSHDIRSSAYAAQDTRSPEAVRSPELSPEIESIENLRAALSREILPSPSQEAQLRAHADDEELPHLPPPPAAHRPREGSLTRHDSRTHSGLHSREFAEPDD